MSDARARDGEHYITLRFGVTVPVAVRAETIHAIKATATLDDVSRALERDEAFASAWPGRLARRDFKPVEGSLVSLPPKENGFRSNVETRGTNVETEPATSDVAAPSADEEAHSPISAADALADAKAVLEERRMEAMRLAAEVAGDTRTTSSGRSWQRMAALGAAAGGERGAEAGSGWFFAAAGAAVAAAAAAAAIAARTGRDRGTAAERLPLTGVGATATVC
jgi:hypothetical protein